MMKSISKSTKKRRQFPIAEFAIYIIRDIRYIALAALLGALGTGIYASCCIPPLYTATAKLYILGENKLDISTTAYKSGSLVTLDYQEIFQTWEVRQNVQSKLGLEDSYEDMENRLTVYHPAQTRVLYISYASENPDRAAAIANAFAASGKEFMLQKMDKQRSKIFSIAMVPGEITGLGKKAYIVMGGLFGAAVMTCFFFLKFTFDDRPKVPEDIQCIADIPVLAVIPGKTSKQRKSEIMDGRNPKSINYSSGI